MSPVRLDGAWSTPLHWMDARCRYPMTVGSWVVHLPRAAQLLSLHPYTPPVVSIRRSRAFWVTTYGLARSPLMPV